MKILITGAAGFVGFHTAKRLVNENIEVIGLDNINDYYSTDLKYDRLNELGISKNSIQNNILINSSKYQNYKFIKLDLSDKDNLLELFKTESFDIVINLAAQAGVRYSIENPDVYIQSNIIGFFNILESCRNYPVKHLVYASSSSVYGNSQETPFSVDQKVDKPVSLYAATKVTNELMAYTYNKLYDIPSTGLRFFTVYGPWGRPDMAYFLFTNAILKNEEISVFNNGKLERDYTYIDDIVEGIYRLLKKSPNEAIVTNIGNGSPVNLMDFISEIETQLKIEAKKKFVEMQSGDVYITWADTKTLEDITGYKPKVKLKEGIKKFIEWYKKYYKVD